MFAPRASHVVLAALLLLAPSAFAQIVEESGSLRGFLAGSEPAAAYDNWISHTSEGIYDHGYNDYGPPRIDPQDDQFGDFRLLPPSTYGDQALTHWRSIFDALLDQSYQAAAQLLADSASTFRYELVHFQDTDTGRDVYIIREWLDLGYIDRGRTPLDFSDDIVGSFRNGWGLYVFNPNAARANTMIQVPHPNDDWISFHLAMDLWDRLDAAFFAANGAGREVLVNEYGSYSNNKSLSDPTRHQRHPFNVATAAFADRFGPWPELPLTWQIHSFDPSHDDKNPVIFSAGYGTDDPHLPLRDESYEGDDIFNLLPHPVWLPEDWAHLGVVLAELGIDDYTMLHINDPFMVIPQPGDTLFIEDAPGLIGNPVNYPGNYLKRPGHYVEGQAIEPFVHIEFDEFPSWFEDAGVARSDLYDLNVYPPEHETYGPLLDFYEPALQAIEDWYLWYDSIDGDTPPPAPAEVWAQSDDNGSLVVGWEGPEDGKLLGYEVLSGVDPDWSGGNVIWTQQDDIRLRKVGFGATTRISGLEAGTHRIAVRQVDLAGQVGPISAPIVAGNTDNQGVELQLDLFNNFPVDAWPAWLFGTPQQDDVLSVQAVWRLNGGVADTLDLHPVGGLGAWAAPLPGDLHVEAGDLLEYRLHTTDTSPRGNPIQYPASGWYEVELLAGPTGLDPISFERDDDRFLLYGDWEIGVPASGPGSAWDGDQVLATELEGPYGYSISFNALVRDYIRPEYGPLVVTWWQAFDFPLDDQYPGIADAGGRVRATQASYSAIAPEGGYPFTTIDGYPVFSGQALTWHPVVVDLLPVYGEVQNLQFNALPQSQNNHDGWYIDQLQLAWRINEATPDPFVLEYPGDGGLLGEAREFRWQPAVDSDPHAWPSYRLHLEGAGRHVVLTAGTQPALRVSHHDLAGLGEAGDTIAWWVEAISQGDTVASRQRRTLTLLASAVEQAPPLPLEFTLHPPYPNPFNSTVRMQVDLPTAREVKVRVVNLLGRTVRTIDYGPRAAGRHELLLAGGDLASGVYFLALQAGTDRAVRKVVLMK